VPGATQVTRHPLPHRDHEGRREKDADLAELDFLRVVVVACRAQYDQLHILVVALDLRPHVNVQRILDRRLMQPEGVPDLRQLLFVRLEQAQPDKAALPAPGRRLPQRYRAFVAPAAIQVVSAIYIMSGILLVGSRGRYPLLASRNCPG